MLRFQLVRGKCQNPLTGTDPQIPVQCAERAALFHFHIQKSVIFVIVTELLGSLIETGQTDFGSKPQIPILVFYN